MSKATSPLDERFVFDDCRGFIRQHPLANLITHAPGAFHATAIPVIFESDEPGDMRMICHLARRTPQAESISTGQPALAVFSGPNAYISASWYKDKLEVPTWNYVSVQVRGVLTPLDDLASNRQVLARMAEFLERDQSEPWSVDGSLSERVDLLLPYIRSFHFDVESIGGIARLSQKHPRTDQLRVVSQLIQRGGGNDLQIAHLISRNPDV
jgi:transcriptional regulator